MMIADYPGKVINVGLYGRDMHDYVLMEAELGGRVAACADAEACGDSALAADPPETMAGIGPDAAEWLGP